MNNPLTIAFIDYVLEPDKPGRSGLSDVVWDMAIALTNLGHEAHIIGSYQITRYPDPRIHVHNFAPPPIGYRNLLGHFWILKRAVAIAKQLQPDIVHAPEYLSTAIAAQLAVKCPLVLTVPGNIYERVQNGHDFEWFYVQVLKWAARKSARQCAIIIATSQEMKRWWQWTGSSQQQTPLIPYGVSIKRFHPVPTAHEQLGLDSERSIFLFAGRFSVEKGLCDLLEALALIKVDLTQINPLFVLIGRGNQEVNLREQVRLLELTESVLICDWVAQDRLKLWYSAAQALILPSHSEGFSRSIPEAMACGTPVIGSRITGTVDHVQHGKTGLLFPAGDIQALAAVLYQALIAPQLLQQMGENALTYVQEHLTWRNITERIVSDVYRPLLST